MSAENAEHTGLQAVASAATQQLPAPAPTPTRKQRQPSATADTPLACPFVVAVDTREQLGWDFAGIHADARDKCRPLAIATERRTLDAGDYSIVGAETVVAIERKSAADLFGTLARGRGRFQRELERMEAMAAGRVFDLQGPAALTAVVVEADWHTITTAPPEFSKLPPKIVFRSVIAWQLRYPHVHWWLCPGRRFAEVTTFRLLERWWRVNGGHQ